MSAVETLTKARDLIARPGGWTQHTCARDEHGIFCDHQGRDAVCFCAAAAYERVGGDYDDFRSNVAFDGDVIGFNDRHGQTQAEVVAAFDRAIALAQAEETP